MKKRKLKTDVEKIKNILKDKKIKSKIIRDMVLSVALPLSLVTIISLGMNYYSVLSILDKTLTKSAEVASSEITNNLDKYKVAVSSIGENQIFGSDSICTDEKQLESLFNNVIKNYDFISFGYSDSEGNTIYGTDISEISDPACFEYCITNRITTISDLMINPKTNEPMFVIVTPIIRNDKIMGTIYGLKDAAFLSQITKNMKFGDKGSCYILNKNGDIIAHDDMELVKSKENIIKKAENDSSQKKLADIHKKMINGETGFGKYTYNLIEKNIAYTTIDKTNSWSIGLAGETNEFLSGIKKEIIINIILAIVLILLSVKHAKILANNISNPINLCVNRLEALSNGDLQSDIPEINTDDETKILAEITKKTVESFRMYILDIKQVLGSIAYGDLTVESSIDYNGDFEEIKKSLTTIIEKLNEVFKEINEATVQVHGGSTQVSQTAQSLATGATEQSESIGDLFKSISEINSQITATSNDAQHTDDIVNNLVEHIEEGNEKMNVMLEAMIEIESSSKNIKEIIKTIDSIAEETNLLALNAAIEAARAGEAGKGFAVVAEQVKKLAEQSSQAVKSTTDLIENSIESVNNGKLIADNTSKVLREIVERTGEVTELVSNITKSAQKESDSIQEVNAVIEKISDVVHSNSAVAEESAAASEELTAQAETLDSMIKRFKLN